MKATIVIPTFNRASLLAELLNCLTTQGDGLARVVVCDDGSTDDTAAVVRSFVGRLPVVYAHQENRGFRAGQARNLGIARAVGEVIIFVDDDVLVAPDFVEGHLTAHGGPGQRLRMAVGYRSRAFGYREQAAHAAASGSAPGSAAQPSWDDILRAEADDRVGELGPEGHGIGAHPTPWFFVYSCNFSITRSEKTPRFDENFIGWGMEDIEFGYRLHRTGYEVVAAAHARVMHIEDSRPRDPFRCEVRAIEPVYDSYVHNAIYFMDKYPGDPVLAELIRTDMRWFVRDEARGCWVKNGHANDVDAVLEHCRRERAQRAKIARHGSATTPHIPSDAAEEGP
jgi:glycosyltransferase involved in cell wall biosynthesis